MYSQSMFCAKIRKKSTENFQFLQLKKYIYIYIYIAWANFRNQKGKNYIIIHSNLNYFLLRPQLSLKLYEFGESV